jgi:hypothetical protein
MNELPQVTIPYFQPLGVEVDTAEQQKRMTRAASREAVREQMARETALGRPRLPKPELPPIKTAVLPENYEEQLTLLDKAIRARGVAIDTDKLLALGQERFTELLAADRKARSLGHLMGTRIDLTSFSSVQQALRAFEVEPSKVPRRKTSEQLAGSGKDRDAVRPIKDWFDLWKFTQDPEAVKNIYAFHDAFESLRFGHSMLDQLSSDGRLRGRLFIGGHDAGVDLLDNWLSVLAGLHNVVKLDQPLWSLMTWLADEHAPAPETADLAREFCNVHAPSPVQIRLAEAIVDGFLLGYEGWALWEFVGRRTRALPEPERLSAWRAALGKRYRAITDFHASVRAAFYKDVGYGPESHRECDLPAHRAFVDRTVKTLLDQLSGLLALAVGETFPDAVVARFQGAVLLQGKHKPMEKRATIGRWLAAAFPDSGFQLMEVQL